MLRCSLCVVQAVTWICVYRPDAFYVPPFAHLLLYGLSKDFLKLWLRKTKDAPSGGQPGADLIFSSAVRTHITGRFALLLITRGFRKAPSDLVR